MIRVNFRLNFVWNLFENILNEILIRNSNLQWDFFGGVHCVWNLCENTFLFKICVFLPKRTYIFSLLIISWIHVGILIKLWKLARDGATHAKAWAVSLDCLLTNLTWEFLNKIANKHLHSSVISPKSESLGCWLITLSTTFLAFNSKSNESNTSSWTHLMDVSRARASLTSTSIIWDNNSVQTAINWPSSSRMHDPIPTLLSGKDASMLHLQRPGDSLLHLTSEGLIDWLLLLERMVCTFLQLVNKE